MTGGSRTRDNLDHNQAPNRSGSATMKPGQGRHRTSPDASEFLPRDVTARLTDDGRLAVVLSPVAAAVVAEALSAHWYQRVRAARPLPPLLLEVSDALRLGSTLAAMRVPVAEPNVAGADPAAAQSVTTATAAALLGVTDRAVRKRIRTGRLRATRVGRAWMVATDQLEDHRWPDS